MQQLLGSSPLFGQQEEPPGKDGGPGGMPGMGSAPGSSPALAMGSFPALARAAASDDNATLENQPGYVNPRRALWGGFLSDMANHFLSGRTAGIGGMGPQAMFGAIQNNQAIEERMRNQAMQALQQRLIARQLTEPKTVGDKGVATFDPQAGRWNVQQPEEPALGGFEGMGTSMGSWARQTIFRPDADPTSSEYLAAWDALYGAKTQVDPTTGRTYEVQPSPPPNVPPPPGYYADGAPGGGRRGEQVTTPRLSDTEAKAGEFLNRMLPAVAVMTELEQGGFRPTQLQWQTFKRAPDLAMSQFGPEAQRYFRAVDSFVRAKLRRESGAAISAQEYEDEGRGAIILPGMEGAVVGDVQRERIATVRGIRRGAGAQMREDPEITAAIEELAAMLEAQGETPAAAEQQAREAITGEPAPGRRNPPPGSRNPDDIISIPGVEL